MLQDTLLSQYASTHQIWNSYLKEYRRYDRTLSGTDGLTDRRTDVRPILNIGPAYKGPLIRGQVPGITGQFSSELAR